MKGEFSLPFPWSSYTSAIYSSTMAVQTFGIIARIRRL